MSKRASYKYDVFLLWGGFESDNIALEYESDFENAQPGHLYRRILVFVLHPNRLFYRRAPESINQDQLIKVAANIAQVHFVEGYYTEEIWRKLVPVDFKNRAIREHYGKYYAGVNEIGDF